MIRTRAGRDSKTGAPSRNRLPIPGSSRAVNRDARAVQARADKTKMKATGRNRHPITKNTATRMLTVKDRAKTKIRIVKATKTAARFKEPINISTSRSQKLRLCFFLPSVTRRR